VCTLFRWYLYTRLHTVLPIDLVYYFSKYFNTISFRNPRIRCSDGDYIAAWFRNTISEVFESLSIFYHVLSRRKTFGKLTFCKCTPSLQMYRSARWPTSCAAWEVCVYYILKSCVFISIPSFDRRVSRLCSLYCNSWPNSRLYNIQHCIGTRRTHEKRAADF